MYQILNKIVPIQGYNYLNLSQLKKKNTKWPDITPRWQ